MKSRIVVVDDFLEKTTWEEIQEEMSETAPRFLMVICPVEHKDGKVNDFIYFFILKLLDRKSYPVCQIYYSPEGKFYYFDK